VLKEVAERLREKQNASKRAAAGRKDEDGMDVDEPGGSNKNRKYVASSPSFFRGVASDADGLATERHRRWSRRAPSAIGCDGFFLRCLLSSAF
jgi:hypothetical protein